MGTNAFTWKTLPCFVCWEVWKQRNSKLFVGKEAKVWVAILKALSYFKDMNKEKVA